MRNRPTRLGQTNTVAYVEDNVRSVDPPSATLSFEQRSTVGSAGLGPRESNARRLACFHAARPRWRIAGWKRIRAGLVDAFVVRAWLGTIEVPRG
jgi:hypothetical protein